MAPLRVLDFYSGIGGLHSALNRLLPKGSHDDRVKLCDAFDVNSNANVVYTNRWQHKVNPKSLEHLALKQLDYYRADLWLLSPPCQPYAR